jgi:hypothetical protein
LKNRKTETVRVIARIHFKQETGMCLITKHYILNRRGIFSTFFFRFCVAQKLLFFVDFQSRRKKIALGSMNKNKPLKKRNFFLTKKRITKKPLGRKDWRTFLLRSYKKYKNNSLLFRQLRLIQAVKPALMKRWEQKGQY